MISNERAPEWIPVERAVDALVEDIEAVADGGVVRIFCGEAGPDVYNQETFLKAVRDVTRCRAAKVFVVTGPLLLINDEGRNGLLSLHHEGSIELYHRLARGSAPHFRVVETGPDAIYRYYEEHPHRPMLPVADRKCANFKRVGDEDLQRLALAAIQVFEDWIERLSKMPKSYSKELPLRTTQRGLTVLMDEAKDKGQVLKYLGPKDILELPSASVVVERPDTSRATRRALQAS